MISVTPPIGVATAPLPRRDILAVCAFLNRYRESTLPDCDPFEQADGILQQLAAAARMQ